MFWAWQAEEEGAAAAVVDCAVAAPRRARVERRVRKRILDGLRCDDGVEGELVGRENRLIV